jgi:nucleoside-diphosphate-sugar epimerase
MKIVIIGGNGLIGTKLVNKFRQLGGGITHLGRGHAMKGWPTGALDLYRFGVAGRLGGQRDID